MAPRDRRLSDDWEDVGDDNLSVISFSSESEVMPAPASPKAEIPAETPNASLPESDEKVETLAQRKSPKQNKQDDPFGIYHRDSEYSPSTAEERSSAAKDEVKEAAAESNTSSLTDEAEETVQASAAEPLEDPFQDPSDDACESREEDDEDAAHSINEIIDDGSRDLDPVFLSKTHQSLVDIINDTLRVVRETPVLGKELTIPSVNICKELQQQLSRMLPILKGYVNAAAPKEDAKIPLDAGLHEWLSGVRVKVLSLLAETQRLGREPYHQQYRRQGSSLPWCVDVLGQKSELERIWDELAEYKHHMGEFLPVLEADYNEFHTQCLILANADRKLKAMSIRSVRPSVAERIRSDACPEYSDAVHPNTLESTQREEPYRRNSPQETPRRVEKSPAVPIDIPRRGNLYSGRPPLPSHDLRHPFSPLTREEAEKVSDRIWHLRREMYQLKDALQAALGRLHWTASNKYVALPLSEWAAVLGSRYDNLLRQVTIVVSNHASDWIESIASGGLTYREFMQLEKESLNMYTAQLAEIVGETSSNSRDTFRADLSPRSTRGSKGPGLNGDELDVMEITVKELEQKFKVITAPETKQ